VAAGALLALVADLPHRAVAATMSLGAGLVLAAASVELAAGSLHEAGAGVAAAGIVGGAAVFNLATAVLAMARDR
jgi:zinc transporter, ZIP family